MASSLLRSVVVTIALCLSLGAVAQEPFISKGQIFIVVDGSRQFGELSINPSNGAILFNEINPDIGLDLLALGYRSADRLVYGVDSDTRELHRIDATGQVEELTTLALDDNLVYPAGDITPDGRYFILVGSGFGVDLTLFKVDLSDPGYSITTTPLPGMTDITDIGFDPLNGSLFGHDQSRKEIVRININTGNITALSPVEDQHAIFGVYVDPFGQLLGFGTTASGVAGAIFRIDLAEQREFTASTGPVYLIQDLAAAPYTIDLRTAVDPQRAFPCSDVEFIYTIGNGDASTHPGIDLSHPLPAGFVFQDLVQNDVGGSVDMTGGFLTIRNITVPPGVHTLRATVGVSDIAGGNYASQAMLDALPAFMGSTRLSDDPSTAQSSDATKVEVVRIDEDSIFVNVFICDGDTAFLDGTEYGSDVQWMDGAVTPVRAVTESGVFVLEAMSGCQSAFITFSVTSASCPFTIELEHTIHPKETFPCSEVIFRFVVNNDAGGAYSNIDFLDTLPDGMFLVEVRGDALKGNVVSGDPGVVLIEDMHLPFGLDTLELLIEVGDIAPGEYQNRGRISNLPMSIGQYRFSDDPETVDLDPTSIVVLGVPTDTFFVEQILCAGTSIMLDGSAYGTDHAWENGTHEPTLEVDQTGTYQLTAFTGCEPTYIFFEVVQGDPVDVAFDPPVVEINLSDSIQLEPTIQNGGDTLVYEWRDVNASLTCYACPLPFARPLRTTDVELVVDNGVCQDSAVLRIRVDNARRLYFPNVFSPNNDGVNDFFFVQSPDFGIVEFLAVADRWGNQVYASKDVVLNVESTGWDGTSHGKSLAPGVYVFHVRIAFFDGLSEDFAGQVAILR